MADPVVTTVATSSPAATGAGRAAGGDKAAESGFARFLRAQLENAEATLAQGEKTSIDGLLGKADVQSVVEAVNAAELTLRQLVAVRDRVIAAYQEIIRMPV